MSINLTVNGQTYAYPEQSDTNWGSAATDWAQAVTVGMLQKAGGLFQLLAEVDFGTTYGVKSVYFKSRTSTPATAGQVRLAKTDTIEWRNDADDGDNVLSVSSSDDLLWNGVSLAGIATASDTATIDLTVTSNNLTADIVPLSIDNSLISASAAIAFSKLASLTSAHILVGSSGNVATDVAVSGDISLSNTGVTAYSGTVPINKGGTGQTTKSAAFDALSPMSASGDLIYGGTSGTGTRLAKGTDGQVLTLASGLPTWAAAAASGANTALSNLASVAINTSLVSDTDITDDLGSSTISWRKLWVQSILRPGNVEIFDLANQRLNDSSGNASIYLDSYLLRTGPHGAPVSKLGWGGSSLDMYVSMLPATNDTLALGDSTHRLSNVVSNQYQLYSTSTTLKGAWNTGITTPSGATADFLRSVVAGTKMCVGATSDSNNNSTQAGSLLLEAANKTSGTGDGGDVKIWGGSSAGGNKGKLFLDIYSLSGASNGDALTLVDNATGEVGFAAGGGGGANTSLSNLSSVAVNTHIAPDSNANYNFGSDSNRWNNVYFAASIELGNDGSNSMRFYPSLSLPSGSSASVVQSNFNNVALMTPDDSATTKNIYLDTGNSSGGASGDILLTTGTFSTTKGKVYLKANIIGGFDDGQWLIKTLDKTSTDNADELKLKGGDSVDGTSGFASLVAGNSSGAGVAGDAILQAGSISNASGTPGWATVYGGDSNQSGVDAGGVIICGGLNTGDGNTGPVQISTTDSGGSSTSGFISVTTGAATSTGSTGYISITSGNSSGGTSGPVTIGTGAGNNGSATLAFSTGDGNSDVSGDITFDTGPSTSSNSGNIIFTTSPTVGGTRGAVLMDALYLLVPTGTSDPTGVEGALYANTSTHKLRFYDGTSWVDLN